MADIIPFIASDYCNKLNCQLLLVFLSLPTVSVTAASLRQSCTSCINLSSFLASWRGPFCVVLSFPPVWCPGLGEAVGTSTRVAV